MWVMGTECEEKGSGEREEEEGEEEEKEEEGMRRKRKEKNKEKKVILFLTGLNSVSCVCMLYNLGTIVSSCA